MNGFISYNSYKKENALNETYESFEELYELASDIYERYTKFSLKKARRYAFYDIRKFIKYDYKTLENFLKYTRIGIVYAKNYSPGDNTGAFISRKKNFRDTFKVDFVDKLENSFDYIIVIYKMSITIILHELQHAYDFFRSRDKYNESKERKKFIQKMRDYNAVKDLVNKGVSGDEEYIKKVLEKIKKIENDYYTSYFRQQDEMSSFFTQTIPLLTFYTKQQRKRLMRNLKDVWHDFTTKYQGFNELTPKQKKILARKFSQYYYKVKEEVNAE